MPYKDPQKKRESDARWRKTPKCKEYMKKYYKKNKTIILDRKKENYYITLKEKGKDYFNNKTYTREANIKYYQKNKGIRNKNNAIYKLNKCKTDPNFLARKRVRNLIRKGINLYGNKKVMPSKKYGVDISAIVEHLKPFPEDLSKYHLDHIIPLCSFDLTNHEEIKKAFAPENHQWLLKEENLKKGKKIL